MNIHAVKNNIRVRGRTTTRKDLQPRLAVGGKFLAAADDPDGHREMGINPRVIRVRENMFRVRLIPALIALVALELGLERIVVHAEGIKAQGVDVRRAADAVPLVDGPGPEKQIALQKCLYEEEER